MSAKNNNRKLSLNGKREKITARLCVIAIYACLLLIGWTICLDVDLHGWTWPNRLLTLANGIGAVSFAAFIRVYRTL